LHGNGFLNSGILADPGLPGSHSFTVTFTQPGRYGLDCLIHRGMEATLTVRPLTAR
jgi:plastocyanin